MMQVFLRRERARGGARRALCLPAMASPNHDWPKGPVRWVVAFAAGGAADTVARNIGVRVSEIIGQQVIIENRTGGNAVVAANCGAAVAARRPDLPDRRRQPGDQPVPDQGPAVRVPEDLAAGDQAVDFPQVVAVKQDFPAKTIQEYIAAAKAKPDTISYGTPPAAGMGHMAGEELQRRAGIKLIHAPYRGGADAARDIGAGAIDSVIITTSSIRPPLAGEKARVLAVTSAKRAAIFPDVPTLAESGFPGYDMIDWNGLFAAEGTPPSDRPAHAGRPSPRHQGRQGQGATGPRGRGAGGQHAGRVHGLAEGQRTLLGKLIVDGNIKLG